MCTTFVVKLCVMTQNKIEFNAMMHVGQRFILC